MKENNLVKKMNLGRTLYYSIIALLLLLASGCSKGSIGGWDKEELPIIRIMALGSSSDASLERISEAISKITVERIGCRINLEMISVSEYKARIDNLIYDKDFPDIFISLDRRMLNALAENNCVYRLNRLLEHREDIFTNILDEEDWKYTEVGEYIYGIPFKNNKDYYWGFMMRADICDTLNIKPDEIMNLDNLYDVLMLVKDSYPNITPLGADYQDIKSFEQYDPLGNGAGVLMYGQNNTSEIVNFVETEEFLELCIRMREWYNKGLILENVAYNKISSDDLLKDGDTFGVFVKASMHTQADMEYAIGTDLYFVPLSVYREDDSINTEAMCIYSYSPHYNLCLDFLELLYSNPELLELCIYGQEGTDYKIMDENTITGIDSNSIEGGRYFSSYWPNRSIVRRTVLSEGAMISEQGKRPIISAARDFIFNDEAVKKEVYDCKAVMDKYYYALTCGMIDPYEGISMLRFELDAVGIDLVIKEKQRQYDNWLNMKNP